jgi:hypothetical protein
MSYSHLRKFITLQQRALRLKEGQGMKKGPQVESK